MSELAGMPQSLRLRAPKEDGQTLLVPPLADEAGWVQQNVALRRSYDYDVDGCALGEMAEEARRTLLQAARQFTSRYLDLPATRIDDDAPVILVGHQPELVHPGVWFKNFVLSQLAKRTSAHAVHILCDNDAVGQSSIQVPCGPITNPRVTSVPLDRPTAAIAYQQRPILDPDQFRSFAKRAAATIRPLIRQPLLQKMWPWAVEAMEQGENLGQSIARARHRLEAAWGLSTLEVPLGQLCCLSPARRLTLHLLDRAARFRTIHNESLAQFRTDNRIRSHTHPVPPLICSDSWIETPFWIWTRDVPTRRPLFVRRHGSQLRLTDRAGLDLALHFCSDDDRCAAESQLERMETRGISIRPRALTTTLLARLLWGDVFIHGIGGAKYDELTDAIIRRFFAIQPPTYLVATLTAMLPLPHPPIRPEDVRRIDQLVRQLRYHPESHVPITPETRHLVKQKHYWIQTEVPTGKRRERHHEIERINLALQPFLDKRRQQLVQERRQLHTMLKSASILNARDYAFCLFPEPFLRQRLLELVDQDA